MSGRDENHERWMEIYRRRAALDPLRATIDERDPDNRKNEYVDLVQRVWIRRLIGRERVGTAADLGAGAVRLTGLLAARAETTIAMDASADLLAAARRRGPPAGVRLVQGDFRALPIRDGSIDLAFSCDALLHLVNDEHFAAAAREIRRILAPGGRALLVEHVSASGATERKQGVIFRDPADFEAAFAKAGLALENRTYVRKVPSRLVHWVRRRRLPKLLWPLAARLEARLAERGRASPDYREAAFLFRRER